MNYGEIAAKVVWDGGTSVAVPKEMGEPRDDQLQGSPADKLSELAGRVCYDSCGSGRNSKEYHEHILKVKHLSVYGHYHFTIETGSLDLMWALQDCINRPGLWVRMDDATKLRITASLRTVLEWDKWANAFRSGSGMFSRVQDFLINAAIRSAPTVACTAGLTSQQENWSQYQPCFVSPRDDEEKWVTMFLQCGRTACYDQDTEVLTANGWVRWPDITGEESFATLNQKTHLLEYQKATRLFRERYCGKMYKLKTKMVDLCVTPNHSMYVRQHDTQAARRKQERWQIIPAMELYGRRVEYNRSANWDGKDPATFTIPDYTAHYENGGRNVEVVCKGLEIQTEVFAEFLGYWIAEGSLHHGKGTGYSATLTQDIHSDAFDRMLRCVSRLGWSFRVCKKRNSTCREIVINGGRALFEFLHPYHLSHNKGIPKECKQWSSRLHRILIDAYLAGDGSFAARGSGEGHTVSRRLADDLQEAALKAGWSAGIRTVDRRNAPSRLLNGHSIRHTRIIYVVGFSKVRNTPLINHNGKRCDSWIDYDGMVYCVTVPNGTLYVRRNDIPVWSGNSHEQVRHDFRVGTSQRSTRFCDEDESPWVVHPLLMQALSELPGTLADTIDAQIENLRTASTSLYNDIVESLTFYLKSTGADRLSCRKQARGAARGFLPNNLQTQLIFSASVAQWKRMIEQRLTSAADAEIRDLYAQVLLALQQSRYGESFASYQIGNSSDGVGVCLIQ